MMKKQLEAIVLIVVLLVAIGAFYFIFKQGTGVGRAGFNLDQCLKDCLTKITAKKNTGAYQLAESRCYIDCENQAKQQPPQPQPLQGGGTTVGGPGTVVIAGGSGGDTIAQSPPPCTDPCDDGNPDTCEDACDASGKCVGKGGAILCGDTDCGYSQKKCVAGVYSETPACDCKFLEGRTCGDFADLKVCHGCRCVEMTSEETDAVYNRLLVDTCRDCSKDDPTFFDKCLDLAGKGADLYGYIGSPTPHFDKDRKCDGVSLSWTIRLGKSKK